MKTTITQCIRMLLDSGTTFCHHFAAVIGVLCAFCFSDHVLAQSSAQVPSSGAKLQGGSASLFAACERDLQDISLRASPIRMSRPEDFQLLKKAVFDSREDVNIITASNTTPGEAFLKSVAFDMQQFVALTNDARKHLLLTSTVAGVTNAANDLRLKRLFLDNTKSAVIATTVNTVDLRLAPVQGCVVYYAPHNNYQLSNYIKFDELSTPTTQPMPPGCWDVWAAKDGEVGNREPYICGGNDNRTSRTITIHAP